MIRCGAFFSFDEERASAAAKTAERIAAAGTSVNVRDSDAVGLGSKGVLVSLDYEGTGAPVVHGVAGEGSGRGEYTALSKAARDLEASRDFCGTRPLYVGASGKWVASDHRFLLGESAELIPPGSVVPLPAGRRHVTRVDARRIGRGFDEAAAELASLIRESVTLRVAGKRRVAVSFSGGLDSSIVAHCAAARCKVIACSASTEGSTDSKVAKDSAGTLGFEFMGAVVNQKSLARELRSLSLPFEPSPMDRSLWCIYSFTAKLAAESESEIVMLGQLADELFGGYAKYESALRRFGEWEAEKMMSEDVVQCGMRGFIRDEAACRAWCEPRFPFAEREVALFGGRLPVSFKIKDGVRKAVLREAAMVLGVPKEIAQRPKKAAQYSSGVLKLLG